MESSKRELALALDLEEREACFQLIQQLKGVPLTLKFGLRFLPFLKPEDLKTLKAQGFKIFIDAKLHDIPTQVGGAVRTWGRLGADYITVHLSGGAEMLKQASHAATETGAKILGVSALTSLGENDLRDIGVKESTVDHVSRLVELGLKNGVHYFVSSVAEVSAVKCIGLRLSENAYSVTPGLRMGTDPVNSDQARSYTVEEAVASGAHMLVVGRSILKASDPAAKAREVLNLLR